MNLEAVEQRCLAYLKQVSNPLVPLDTLLRHVRRDESLAEVTRKDLLRFLRHHELFTVLEPVGLAADPEGARILEAEGIETGPFVVLCTRVPTRDDLAKLLMGQMDTLLQSLQTALAEAQDLRDAPRIQRVTRLIKKAEVLREKLSSYL